MTVLKPVPDDITTGLEYGAQAGGKLQLKARGEIIGCLAAKRTKRRLADAHPAVQAAASGNPVDKRAAVAALDLAKASLCASYAKR